MQLQLRGELPFVTASLTFRDMTVEIADVLVDTGAASTILNADFAAEAGVYLEVGDRLRAGRRDALGVLSDRERVKPRAPIEPAAMAHAAHSRDAATARINVSRSATIQLRSRCTSNAL